MSLQVTIVSTGQWGASGNGNMKVTNTTSNPITNWSFKLTTSNFVVSGLWNFAVTSTSDNVLTISPQPWKQTLNAGESIESGFSYTGSNVFNYTIVGDVKQPPVVTPTTPTTPTTPVFASKKLVFAYFAEWSIYSRQYGVSKIPVNKITHLMYAFMLPHPSQADFDTLKQNYPFPPTEYVAPPAVAEGTLVYHDKYAAEKNMNELRLLRQQNPSMKVLISIGGWSLSWTLSKVAADPVLRKNLVTSAVKFVVDNNFDGLDFDWEFVGVQGPGYNYVDEVNDGKNLLLLLKDTRAEMNKQSPNKRLEITCASGTNPKVIANYKGAEQYLDYLLLMTYDYAGAWGDGGHHVGLYNNPENNGFTIDQFWADAAVKNSLKIGFKPSQLAVGVAAYARGWKKIDSKSTKVPIFGKSMEGAGTTYSGEAGESGVTSWRHMKDKLGASTGLIEGYDSVAEAGYCYNSTTGEAWSFETERSATKKAQYVKNNNLAGCLMWELSDDSRDGQRCILDAIVAEFKKPVTTPVTPPVVTPPVVTPPVVTPPVVTPPVVTPPVVTPPVVTPPVVTPPVVTPPVASGLTVVVQNNTNAPVTIKAGQSMVFVLKQ